MIHNPPYDADYAEKIIVILGVNLVGIKVQVLANILTFSLLVLSQHIHWTPGHFKSPKGQLMFQAFSGSHQEIRLPVDMLNGCKAGYRRILLHKFGA